MVNANNFLMSLIVVGLAAPGGSGQEARAEPPAEIGAAAEQPVAASGEATEEMREAKASTGDLMDDTVIKMKVKAAMWQHPAPRLSRSPPVDNALSGYNPVW